MVGCRLGNASVGETEVGEEMLSHRKRRPRFEALEARAMLAVMTVTDLSDGPLESLEGDGKLSLREAIAAINTASEVDGIGPTSGVLGFDDTIVFDEQLFENPSSILMSGGELALTAKVAIHGPGKESLTLDAQGQSRIFRVTESASINNLTVSRGMADDGGGILTSADLTLDQVAVTHNNAKGIGGGLGIADEAHVIIRDSDLIGNTSAYGGGAIGMTDGLDQLRVVISHSDIRSNKAGSGGGIYVEFSRVALDVTDSNIEQNIAEEGGGIYMEGPSELRLRRVELSNNQAFDGGGLLLLGHRSLAILDSTIHGNIADGGLGGGAWFETVRTVIANSTFSANRADVGGGITVQGGYRVTVANSTISGNVANVEGGGIYVDGHRGDDFAMLNTTVTSNSSPAPGSGVSIQNNSSSGGSVSFELGNSIVAGNEGPTDLFLTTVVDFEPSHSLVGRFVAHLGAHRESLESGGNLTGVSPLLGPLADHGGPTKTHALLSGSPAIDAGSNVLLDQLVTLEGNPFDESGGLRYFNISDQRVVFERSVGNSVDMGSFEVQPFATMDFGDAPEPYPVRLEARGPSHLLSAHLYLGDRVHGEVEPRPSKTASASHRTNADNDGVHLPGLLTIGETTTAHVESRGTGLLSGWVDWNADGDWEDAGEQVFADWPADEGLNDLQIRVPASAKPTSQTYARFRLSTTPGLSFSGPANDGEVEDYLVGIAARNAAPPDADVSLTVDATPDVLHGGTRVTLSAHISNPSAVVQEIDLITNAAEFLEDVSHGWEVRNGATLDLHTLDALNGFAFQATPEFVTGDINGDGLGDLVVRTGRRVSVLFGDQKRVSPVVDLEMHGEVGGFVIQGGPAARPFQPATADVNGDGFDDILLLVVVTNDDGTESNRMQVIFGGADEATQALDLNRPEDLHGFVIHRIDGNFAGAGDVNGDGFEDILVADRARNRQVILFGKPLFPSEITLEVDGTTGFLLADRQIRFATALGDVNADGFDDMAVGFSDDPASYVLFGEAAPFPSAIELPAIDVTAGLRLEGLEAFDIRGVGDLNNDGVGDLAVLHHDGGEFGVDVVLGDAAWRDRSRLILPGGSVTRLKGLDGAHPPRVASAGDVSGDGQDDLVVGSGWDPTGTGGVLHPVGRAHVIHGPLISGDLDVRQLDGVNGFTIPGIKPLGHLGGGVHGLGDFNGDGFDDILLRGFVVFGGPAGTGRTHGSNATGFRLPARGSARYTLTGTVRSDIEGTHNVRVEVWPTAPTLEINPVDNRSTFSVFVKPLPGDSDRDGQVNFADFITLSTHFGKASDAVWAEGDFNEDGKVDFSDFILLAANFGRSTLV